MGSNSGRSWNPVPRGSRSDKRTQAWLGFTLGTCASLVVSCGKSNLEQEPKPVSALLITLDTTNPGTLDCYGKDRGLTPNLAALAAESVVFDQARTVAPLTLPSHTSMLTGLTPPRHSVRDNSLSRVPEAAETLAELAQAKGYTTAAILSAAVLAAPYGLDQGFEHYDAPGGPAATAGAHMVEYTAERTTRAAQDWLAGRDKDRPFFLWVHYFDPHAPYEPPAEFLEQAKGNAYLGEVAYMDRSIGDLLGVLELEGVLDETAILVVGDHGEALGRHGEPTHSLLCYDAMLRVPLLLRPPGGTQPGRRDESLTSVVDVAPTLQALMGLDDPEMGQDGRDLLGLAPRPGHSVYFESWTGYLNFGFSPLVGVVQGEWKFIQTSLPELYNLAQNPREKPNWDEPIPASQQDRFEALLRARSKASALEASQAAGGAQLLSNVAALGYAGSGGPEGPLPDPLEPSTLPAPQRSTDQMNATYQAILLAHAGKREQAIDELAALVDQNQGNVYAASILSGFLLEEQSFEQAHRILKRLISTGHERPSLLDHAGQASEALGLLEEALGHFERKLELLPNDPAAAEHAVRIRARLNNKR